MMSAVDPVLSRRSRQTGHEVLLFDMRSEHEHGKSTHAWRVVCEPHGYHTGHETRKQASAVMASPAEWCAKCKYEQEHGAPGPGEEICSGCVERLAPSGYPALGRCGPCRGMSEEEGYLKIPGSPGLDVEHLRDCINDGRLEAHLFHKLWRRAEAIQTVEQHFEVVNLVVEEMAWLVAGDIDLSKTSVEAYHRLLEDAAEEEGSDD